MLLLTLILVTCAWESEKPDWMNYVSSRAILATTNGQGDEISKLGLNRLPGEEITIASADSTIVPDDAAHYPVEYINSLQAAGIPLHTLTLKKRSVVMLLRNLSIRGGLCNGTRLIIQDVTERLIIGKIASGVAIGRMVLIPKIQMQPADCSEYGFEWHKYQFPVRVAFAMTIHKSQGQTLKKVVVWLQEPCFGHSQFYVAASRVGNPDNIKFFCQEFRRVSRFLNT